MSDLSSQDEQMRRRLQSLFTQAPVGFALLNGPRYIIEQANPTVCRYWGRTVAQVVGKPLFEALPEAAGQGFEQLLDGVLSSGEAAVGRELPVRLSRLEGGVVEDAFFNFVYEPLRNLDGLVEGVILVATDATEQVRARRAAEVASATRERLSEDRLRRVVEASGTGTWELDVATDRLTADSQYLALTGLPAEAANDARALVEGAPVEERARLRGAIRAALALEQGGRFAIEYRSSSAAEGPERWVEARGQAAFGPDGKAVRLAGTLVDISVRKAAELEREVLLAREEAARAEAEAARIRMESLFQNAPAFMCSSRGPEHIFQRANPLFLQMVGHGRQVIGLATATALPEVVGQGFISLLDRVYQTGQPFVGQESDVRLDKSGKGVLERAYLTFIYQPRRDAKGEVEGIDTFGFDVTEQVQARQRVEALMERVRASEAQLLLVTDAIPLLVAFVGGDERYRLVNKAYEDWFGHPREELVGKTLREVLGEAAYSMMRPHVLRGLAGERFTFEQRGVPYRDGGTRDIRASFVPHKVGETADGYIALVEDVSLQRRLEEERDRSGVQRTELLSRQVEFERQLIGIVSHDLRNPIAGILLNSGGLLRGDELSDRQTRSVVRIQTSAERANRMIRDLLDFTQARLAGRIPITRAASDLHEIVRDVVQEVEATHPGREIRWERSGDGRGDWDPDRLNQVVQNLLTNALKYGPADGPVSVETSGDSSWATLSIHNGGAPIPPERRDRLFHPLERGKGEVDTTSRSIGLGLYIVKHVVDAHRGTVTLESTASEGTTVRVTLPRQGG